MSKILKDTKVSIVQVPLAIVVALASILFLPPLSSSVQVPIVNKTDATVTPPEPNYSRGFDLIENQQYKAAERYWREIYQKSLGEPTQQAIALQQVAKAQWATRRFKVAMNSLDLAIKKLLNGGDKSLLVAVYYQIATLQIQSDLLKEAEENLQKSMKLVASDRDDLSNIGIDKPDLKNLDLKNLDLNNLDLNNLDLNNLDLNNNVSAISLIKNRLGQIFALQDNHQKALQVFTESYEGFIAIDDRPAALISARNAIKSAVKLQSYALAIDLYSQALLVAETESTSLAPPSIPSLTMMPSLNASQSITTTKIALISVLGNFPKSELEALSIKYLHAVLLLKNMTEAQDINNYNVSYALSVLASLYFRAGETEQALLISNKAILHSQALGPNKLLVRNLMLSGAIYRLQGDRQHALQAYRLAVKEYNSQRTQDISALAGYANTQSLDDIVIDAESLYLSLADLILVNARAEKNQRIVQALLIEARDTIELKKVTELQNYFKNSCDVSRAASKMKIDEIIQSGSAAIYPILLPDRLEILVTFDTGIRQYEVKQDSTTIRKAVNQLRVNLENLNSRAYLTDAKKIYDWIIAPLEAEFKKRNINTLVIISEDTLRTIPFSVLYDGQRYLVEKYALAVAPSLELTAPASLDRKKIRILLSGISDAVQGYPPLPYVRGELEEIQDLYSTKLLLNREFVTKNFEMALRNDEYSIAHLASHSEFKGSVKDSYILTFDGKMSMEQLSDITSLVPGRNRPIDLLTLSACQTAVGDDKAALGLAGVAVKAGARSALATLWSIDDYASSILVSDFYKELLDTKNSKAQALRKAQLTLIRSGRFDHPAYWSPFLMIGNWL